MQCFGIKQNALLLPFPWLAQATIVPPLEGIFVAGLIEGS